MRNSNFIAAIGALSLIASAASAADLAYREPPPPMPIPVEEFGGWYLRGEIGFSNQKVKNLDHAGYRDPGISIPSQTTNFTTAGIYGLGVGYNFNNWLRGDITGQFRGSSGFTGRDLVSMNGTPIGADTYNASKTEWVVMANAYIDLGTWWNITPFIGAGAGMSRNTIAGLTDQGVTNTGFGTSPTTAYADTASKWNFAWALHAGLAYRVNHAMTLELAYSYMNLGNGVTGPLTDFEGYTRDRPFTFNDITSHDVKFGMRWNLDAAPVYLPPPPPLMRRG